MLKAIHLLLVMFLFAGTGAAASELDEINQEANAVRDAHARFIKGEGTANEFNLTYLHAQSVRIQYEINNLTQQLKSLDPWNWLSLANAKTIELKKGELERIQQASQRLKAHPESEIIHSLLDVKAFLENGRIPTLDEEKKLGLRSKRSSGSIFGGNSQDANHKSDWLDDLALVRSNPDSDPCGGLKKIESSFPASDNEINHLESSLSTIVRSAVSEPLLRERAFHIRRLAVNSKPDPLLSDSVDEFFDSKSHPEQAKFLAALGIQKPDQKMPDHVDLSASFNPPRLQQMADGHIAKDCTAFAATSDMEFVGKTPPLSVGLAYGLTRSLSELNYDGGFDLQTGKDKFEFLEQKSAMPAKQEHLPDHLLEAVKNKKGLNFNGEISAKEVDYAVDIGSTDAAALYTLKRFPISKEADYPSTRFIPESLQAVKNRNYRVKSYEMLNLSNEQGSPKEGSVNLGLIKLLVNTKHPPEVITSSEGRVEQEDWMEPRPSSIRHIVNVVAYGTDIDPFDLKLKPYLLIRDSLGSQPIHYKVDASKFLAQVIGIAKVTAVDSSDSDK